MGALLNAFGWVLGQLQLKGMCNAFRMFFRVNAKPFFNQVVRYGLILCGDFESNLEIIHRPPRCW